MTTDTIPSTKVDTTPSTTVDTMASKKQTISKQGIIDFTAGAIGGICCSYVGQPMDTVKVKMQTFPHLYKDSIRCTLDIIKKEGFRKFYAGAVPAAAANVAETSVLFLCYGQCTQLVAYIAGNKKENMTIFQKACSGSFASFFAAFALCPFELVKCRMQTLREIKETKKNM